ncbi:MAG TPA: ACP S-malonyltransferase [bacterium]|nr:ACP S-malonyltransferase [bacterium]
MTRAAAVFPNEGSHYVGMGKEFYDKSLTVRRYYDEAEKTLKLKIAKVSFLGPQEEQDQLLNAQLGTFLNDVAFFDLLVQYKRRPELLTGVGVGEIAALVWAECLSFSAALLFVTRRAPILEAFARDKGGLGLFLSGLSQEQVEPLLDREEGKAEITHYLAPDSFVVWGPKESMDSIQAELKDVRQVKMRPQLPRGPLFTPRAGELEAPLEALLDECLGDSPLKHPKMTFLSAEGGKQVVRAEDARDVLVRQYSRPVRWTQTVRAAIDRGFRTWVEVGPGKTYTSFVKKTDLDTRIMNVEDVKSLTTTIKITG